MKQDKALLYNREN